MAEGAGALVLESLAHAKARGATILGVVEGCGEQADGFHRTRSSPDGKPIIACMHHALQDAGLPPDAIGYINAHGTGTPENDKMEWVGVSAVFGERALGDPDVIQQSMIGHTLTAAGTVEAIFTLLTMRHGRLPPTINYDTPDPALQVDCVPNVARDAQATHAMSNSFGFGGRMCAWYGGRVSREGSQMTDPINAFIPGPRLTIAGAPNGPLSGLTSPPRTCSMLPAIPPAAATTIGRAYNPIPTRHAWAVQTLLDAGASLIGKTITDEVSLGILGENAFDGTPLNTQGARSRAGRFVIRFRGRGRRGSVRHRARHRHRRLGARAVELLRPLRHPADAWAARPVRACCRRRRVPTRPAGSRATPRPSRKRLERCCSARRSPTRCPRSLIIAVDAFGFADPAVGSRAAADGRAAGDS